MTFALNVLQTRPHEPARVERLSPRSVRISVTDRCDMACVYCRPSMHDGYLPAAERLDVDAWESLLRALVAEGVRRVRITGGEPLLMRDLVVLVSRIARLGVEDLALTTNASQLARLARPLRDAGLSRINVSLDSLDAARFERMTRGGDLASVLRGIDAALACGFDEVKTNTVVVRGENDDELASIVSWAWSRGITPRLLEVMGVGEGAKLFRSHGVAYAQMRAAIAHLVAPDARAATQPDRGPARYLSSRDGSHRVGFITGTTDTFCGECDRLRVTSDGVLRACLSRNDGVDVADVVGDAPEVAARLARAWAHKPDASWRGCTEATAADVSMRATGG